MQKSSFYYHKQAYVSDYLLIKKFTKIIFFLQNVQKNQRTIIFKYIDGALN